MPRNTIKSIRLYSGTTQQHSDYAGPVGEITVDTEKYTVVVQNGATGGVPLARESDVTVEAQAREAADTALQKSITDEASARETADNAFQKQIDNSLRRGAVIGEVRWFAMSTPPEGWLVCNGAAVGTSDYAALFAAIGKTFTPQLTSTDPDVENPEYSDPTVFRLPNLMGKTPWGSTSVGTVLDAGLPNITGVATFISSDGVSTQYPDWGALFWSSYNHSVIMQEISGTGKRDIMFDASKSNNIYGASTTVQPPALCLLPCIRYE